MPTIYKKGVDDLNTIELKKGYYLFHFKPKEIPENLNVKHLPHITQVSGKKAVIRDIRQENDEIIVDLWLAENPVWLVPVIYVIGGALLAFGVSTFSEDLEKITSNVFNPAVIIPLAGLAAFYLYKKG